PESVARPERERRAWQNLEQTTPVEDSERATPKPALSRFTSCNLAQLPVNLGGGDRQANPDHDPTHGALAKFSGHARTSVAAQSRTDYHHQGPRPVYLTCRDEEGCGDPVNARRKKSLQSIHQVNVI